MRLVATSLFLLSLAAFTQNAAASTVRITSGHLRYTAGNEANRIKIANDGIGGITFEDGATRIRVGAGCRSTGRSTAVCAGGVQRITISASGGSDMIEAPFMTAAMTLDGAGGNDTLTGGSGNDTLDGDDGNDKLTGGAGNDRLQGDGGNDTETGGPGDDVISGDAGTDVADFSAAPGPLKIDLDGNADDGSGPEKDRVEADVEKVIGSPFGDEITAISGTHTIEGGDGNDTLNGGTGVDTLLGENGDDIINGGVAGDKLDGGAGNDTADYAGRFDPVDLDLTKGIAITERGSGTRRVTETDQLLSFEAARGSKNADVLRGGPGPNLLLGGAGNDILDGRFGADILNGGAGDDVADYTGRRAPLVITIDDQPNDGGANEGDNVTLSVEQVAGGNAGDEITGSARRNTLFGGGGRDTLIALGGGDELDGGPGADKLDGGDGRDVLTGGAGLDELIGGAANDIIFAKDRARDRVECGGGTDKAAVDKGTDAVDGCERINPKGL